MVEAVELDLATLDGFITEMPDADRDVASALVGLVRQEGAALDAVASGLNAPALVEVGRRWAAAEIGVSESRAAATIVRAALLRSAPSAMPAEQASVAVCASDSEAPQLASEMVAEVLRARGWPARLIGADTLPSDVRILLRRRRPAALLVNCTTPCGLPAAARMIDAAHDVGVATVVGGPGFGQDNARAIRLGAAAWAPNVDAGIAVLEEWRTAPPLLAPKSPINEDYIAFVSARAEIKDGAMVTLRGSKFRRREDAIDMASAQAGLELLLCYVEAAILVDDHRVLVDYLTWMNTYSRDPDASVTRLTSLLEAVSGQVPVASPRAGRFVSDGLRHLEWNRPSHLRALGCGGQDLRPGASRPTGGAAAEHRRRAAGPGVRRSAVPGCGVLSRSHGPDLGHAA